MGKPKLYNAWHCPFAQRAWIALLHKGISFDYVEQIPYDRTPEWLAINPRGLVPVIVHNGKSVYESTVCIEYVDEAWPSETNNLLPRDAYQRAHVRMWSDHVNKKIVPQYYSLLMKKTQEERQQYKQEILSGVSFLCENMSSEGPFFLGKEFGMVDIMLAPWAQRFGIVTKYYRDFDIPDNEKFVRYQRWWKAVQAVPSFKDTVQPTDKLVQFYNRYADGTAASQVGDAIRTGKGLP
jgi:glutathione S-transferase